MSTIDLNQVKFLNAFNNIKDVGALTIEKIFEYFKGDFEKAWKASSLHFQKAGVKIRELKALEKRSTIDPEKEIKRVFDSGINILTIKDKNYPPALKNISHPPILLYLKGEIKKEDDFSLAVVGTRKATEYGKRVTQEIVSKLAGFTIVSGLALGIDTFAHQTALANSHRTIAVLGTGLDKESFYPKENWSLSEKIAQNGALISEYPPGTKASKESFPQRNRIISGLSKGVLVIEAPQKSGALITVNFAIQQNRDVFVVPGPIFSKTSQGTNELIKKGARLITSAIDIFQDYNIQSDS